jgi:pimeloyl-ACP methyl ester carboxylesterase
MSLPKPTFLLISGAYHTPAAYTHLIPHLNRFEYPTATVSLPSVSSLTPKAESVAKDTTSILSTLLPLLDAGTDVVLIAHSYGGLPGGSAATALMRSQREKEGKKGGIVAQIYIAAFVAPEGKSLLGLNGGGHAPWVLEDVRLLSPHSLEQKNKKVRKTDREME